MSFIDRFQYLINKNKITHKELEQQTGIKNVSHYKSGRVKPSYDAIVALSDFFGVTTDWLLKGTGPGPDHSDTIPVFDYIPAGTELLDSHLTEVFLELPLDITADFACYIQDDHLKMLGIAKGDLAFFRKSENIQNDQIITAHSINESKRLALYFFSQKNDQAILRSANPDNTPLLLTTHYHIDGVLTALLKTTLPSFIDYEEILHYQAKLNESWSELITLTNANDIPITFVKQLIEQQIKMSKKISQ